MLLRDEFGGIDIYVFDQLLRGRIVPGMRIFDAGCGSGRNLLYFLKAGYHVTGADVDPDAVAATRALAAQLAPGLSPTNFRCEALDALSFEPGSADVVIASAVLHFARGDDHFDAMLAGCWEVLAEGGLFIARLASSVGLDGALLPAGDGRYVLPDGSTRYLVDPRRLQDAERALGAQPVDPLKTTLVHGQRSMTTWVLRKARH